MKDISKENSIFYQLNSFLQLKIARKIILNFNKIIQSLIENNHKNIKILEIGAGNGNLTFLILQEIHKFSTINTDCKFNITITEPNENFAKILKKEINNWKKSQKISIKNIKLSFAQKDFEFFFNKNCNKKFDITLSNFVYHWIEDFNFLFKEYHVFSKYHLFSIPIDKSLHELKKKLKNNNIELFINNKLPSEKSIISLIKNISNKNKLSFYIKKYKIYQTFNNIFEILKFFQKSGFNLKNYNNIQNLQSLKKICQLKDKCKMEFIYLILELV